MRAKWLVAVQRKLGLTAAALIVATAGLSIVSGSGASAATITFGHTHGFGFGIQSVSCSGIGDCTAAGTFYSVTETNGVWGTPVMVGPLNGVSCADATDCTAVGQTRAGEPAYATETHGVWGPLTAIDSTDGQEGFFGAVSCTDATDCTAVGGSAEQPISATETNGVWGPLVYWGPPPAPAIAIGTFTSVSCKGTACTAVGFNNLAAPPTSYYATESNGVWGPLTPFGGQAAYLGDDIYVLGVSCASATDCTAVGRATDVMLHATETGGSWGPLTAGIPGTTGSGYPTNSGYLSGISCTDATDCVAVGQDSNSTAVYTVETAGTWGPATEHGPLRFTSVSCTDGTHCTAVGEFAGGAGSAANTVTTPSTPIPTLTKITPSVGKTAGGTTVTLTGSGFVTGATVTFGSGNHGTTVHVSGTASLTVKAPAHAAGTVTVTVTTSGGTSGTKPYAYDPIPTITSLSRTSGPTSGGTKVTITGTGFSTAAHVKFGTTTAVFTVNSSTSITATAPAHAAGTAVISVTTPGGTTPTTSADHFKYTVPSPVIFSISPTTGKAGTSVTLSGSGFISGATTVTFGGTVIPAGSVTFVSGSQIKVTSPAHAAGTVTVKATTAAGTSASGEHFTYVTGPTITSLSRTTGPVAGGTKVTITGTGFTTVTKVTFGSTTATKWTIRSNNQLVVTAPAHAAGRVGISVTTTGGASPTTSADYYTYH